jgi:hypothetical protein
MSRQRAKTPNALPPTVLQLGRAFNGAGLTLKGARQIASVTNMTIGDRTSNKKEGKQEGHYPYHLIDLNTPDRCAFVRSGQLRCSKRKLQAITRQTVRKVAVFLFENQGQSDSIVTAEE